MNAPTELLNVALFLSFVLGIYNLLIWIRIIMTWVQIPLQKQGPRQSNGLERFLAKVVDPYLNLFKGISWLKAKTIDFSPLLAFALLSIAQSMLSIFGTTGSLTLITTLVLIIQTFYSFIVSPFFFIFIILLIVRLFFCYKRTPTTIVMARGIESIIGGWLNFVQKTFFGSRGVANRTLVMATLVFTIILYVLFRLGFTYLATALASL